MARDILKVRFDLQRIKCHDEGDGLGSAEPYLWVVFFKIDGTTVTLTDSLNLSGTATVEGTFGAHGNLPNDDVDEGETISIPETVGAWENTLVPIPVHASLQGLVDDVPGVAGVAAILMEEDNVSDAGALAGYAALVEAIQQGLDALIPSLGFSNQEVTEANIDQIKSAAEKAIRDAIENQQNFFENIWSWLNADDQIGSLVVHFGHDTLADLAIHPINQRWRNEGDWEIFGEASASVQCPAAAIDSARKILGKVFGRGDLDQMRKFRDGRMRDRQGAREWWAVAERNVASLMRLLIVDPKAAAALRRLVPEAMRLIADDQARIPEEVVRDVRAILEAACRSSSRRLRVDARRAIDVLDVVKGRTVQQALQISDVVRPGRTIDRRQLGALGAHIGQPDE